VIKKNAGAKSIRSITGEGKVARKNVGFAIVLFGVIFSLLPSCQRQGDGEDVNSHTSSGEQIHPPAGQGVVPLRDREEGRSNSLLYQPSTEDIKGKCELELSGLPARGEMADVTFSITPEEDVPLMRVSFSLNGAEFVSGDVTRLGPRLFKGYTSAKANTRTDVGIRIRFVEDRVHVGATAVKIRNKTDPSAPGHEVIRFIGIVGFRYIYDPDLSRYVTWDEFTSKPWWKFDPITGRVDETVSEYLKEENRKWISKMKSLRPDISAWEALYLFYEVLNTSYTPMEGEPYLSDQERAKAALENGWLGRFRETGGQSVLDKFPNLQLPPSLRKRGQLQQKREPELDQENGSLLPTERQQDEAFEARLGPLVSTRCYGTWLYKKYPYDSLYGLSEDAYDAPISEALVAIWGYPADSGFAKYIRGRGLTDNSGNFDFSIDLRSGVLWRLWPQVYTVGPDKDNADSAVIKVVDPTPPADHSWSLPEDSAVFNWQGEIHFTASPGVEQYFDTAYADTIYPSVNQPLSGAVNIYEAILKGYNYLTVPPPPYTTRDTIGSVVGVWEPNHQRDTRYLPDGDSILVKGDTTSPAPTDEWDDHKAIHEYGHHVMHNVAQMGPLTEGGGWWHLGGEDDTSLQVGYSEGWAHFFSGVVIDDTLLRDAKGFPGEGSGEFKNLEDPWIGSAFDTTEFKGGPGCPGAIAGSFWDLFDVYVESLYHSYPDLPEFPDSGLADTLALGFDEIWNIFDDPDPPPPPPDPQTNCWRIGEFVSEWLSPEYDYDHKEGLLEILVHHRISWAGPGADGILKGNLDYSRPKVSLEYGPRDSLADGYCFYRKLAGDTSFSTLTAGVDTTYLDSMVVADRVYVYTLTAYDTLGIQGDSSNNVEIWIPGSDDSLATAQSNAQKIVWNEGDSTLYVAFSSGGSVCCEKSTDFGDKWSVDTVGRGGFPSIALDPDGDVWMVWMGNYGSDAHFSAYRGIFCSRYSSGSWSTPETLQTYSSTMEAANAESESLQCVSFSADSSDTGHVAVTYKKKIIYPDTIATAYHYLDYLVFETDAPIGSVSSQQVRSTTMVQPIGLASIAADNLGCPHIAWEKKDIDPVYGLIKFIMHSVGPAFLQDDTVSNLAIHAYHPYIEYYGDKNRTSAVWDADSNDTFQVYSRFLGSMGAWGDIKKVSTTGSHSRLPVISGSYASWSEWENGVPKRILKSMFGNVTENWGAADTVSESDSASLYVHTLNVPDDRFLFTCWTETDSASYWLAFDFDTSAGAGGVPSYYVDAGRPLASPHLRHRDGYQGWGDKPELTVDTDSRAVSYVFSGLNPEASYELRTVHYYEHSDKAPVGNRTMNDRTGSANELSRPLSETGTTGALGKTVGRSKSFTGNPATESDAIVTPVRAHGSTSDTPTSEAKNKGLAPGVSKPWVMGVWLDGSTSGTVELSAKSVKTFQCKIPQELTEDGALTLDISRLEGDYALVSEIYVHPAENEVRQSLSTGAQLVLGTDCYRFRFHKLAPNPSRGEGILSYELARRCDIEIGVFDVAGRLVTKVSRPGQSPGVHGVTWGTEADNEIQNAATGTYFVRLTAKNTASGAEEFSATRKMIVIR